jgi:hypothetical protein
VIEFVTDVGEFEFESDLNDKAQVRTGVYEQVYICVCVCFCEC